MDQLCEDTGATHTLADTLARHAGCHTVSEWLIELVVHPDTKVAHAATRYVGLLKECGSMYACVGFRMPGMASHSHMYCQGMACSLQHPLAT